MTSKNKKPPEYVGFGYVDFPCHTGGWEDAALGVLTVRLLAVNIFNIPVESGQATFDEIAFDDVLIGSDIHDEPSETFNFLTSVRNSVINSKLLAHINWVGVGKTDDGQVFWACTKEDLTDDGKVLYDTFLLKNLGHQIMLVTSVCRDKDTIQRLLEETDKGKLPKLAQVLS